MRIDVGKCFWIICPVFFHATISAYPRVDLCIREDSPLYQRAGTRLPPVTEFAPAVGLVAMILPFEVDTI